MEPDTTSHDEDIAKIREHVIMICECFGGALYKTIVTSIYNSRGKGAIMDTTDMRAIWYSLALKICDFEEFLR